MKTLPPKIITYYSKEFKCYVAFYQDEYGNQLGDCQYGATKALAVQYLQMENTNE